ncbi:MAG: 3-oxoacid CoA-transferase subunit B, partial [Chloroflexota bacterium]|nr:3-oxoacid CoA-transferase subunit B [Chloroflexota bacterium]
IPAFFTPAGAGTLVERGKEKRVFRGKEYLLEEAITADFALVKAWRGDRFGNLVYRKGGRNFNPIMATAARVTVAEVDEIAEIGALDPETVGTSGVYVDRVVRADPALAPKGHTSVDVVGDLKAGQSKGLTRELIALRVAKELKDGMCVNLGTGLPSLVTDFIPEGMQVTLHAENGIVGYGRLAREDELDPELVIAGGRYIVLNPGASFCHHADAFAMIRGGHVDVTVLGAYQVSEKGDLANWMVPELEMGGIGGAMDLVTGVKRVIVAMEHTTPSGKPKIVKQCTYPLTGKGVVDTIVSNLALIRVRPQGLVLEEVAQGVTPEEVQQATEPKLLLSPDLKTMEL